MGIKRYKHQQKDEEDITNNVVARIEYQNYGDRGMLVYLYDRDISIGFLSRQGFHPMYGRDKLYRIATVEDFSSNVRRKFSTWFKVFKKKEA